jgi:SNF2 family DNA or RNA helicase
VNTTLRQDNIAQFQDVKGPARFFVGNAQTGGYGITLTAANTVIYYSNSYDLEKRLQSEDRAHRIGQTGSVTYVDLVAEGTIDERIIKSLKDKVNIANEIMGEDIKDWI